MITSPQNEKLKLVRKLRERRHRDREGLFVTEGEDLLDAGRAAGAEPTLLLTAAGAGLGGEEVEPELLAAVSTLGSGTRAIAVWPQRWAEAVEPPCVYLHGVGDPGNVGAIVRTAEALLGGTVVLGPDCADPHGAEGGAGEHGRDLRPAPRRAAASRRRRSRGRRSSPTVATGLEALAGCGDALPRRRARGAARSRCSTRCERAGDDPAARRRRRVAQRRRRGGDRLPADIVARHAGGRRGCLTGSRR